MPTILIISSRLLLSAVFIYSFSKCSSPTSTDKPKFFNPANISQLQIEELNGFWSGDSFWAEKYPNNLFRNYTGYLEGKEFRSANNKFIAIHVFESKEIALAAIDYYRINISALTSESNDHTIIKEQWWYIAGPPYLTIFVNKLNTMIIISNYEAIDSNITIETAIDIMEKIEKSLQ